MKTYVVLNDIQIPFQDDRVLYGLVLPFVDDLRPNGAILNGDIVDCYSISSHRKQAKKLLKANLNHEINGAQKLMRSLSGIDEKWWIGGNHENRYPNILNDLAPQLGIIDGLDFQTVFGLGEHGFKWKEYGEYVMLGKLMVTHGDIVRKHSGYSAKAHFDKFGTSVLHGHTHRLGFYAHTNIAGVHGAWENGCLCKLDGLGYTHNPDWQQGFSVVHVDTNGFFHVQLIPIINRKLFYYGKERFEVKK